MWWMILGGCATSSTFELTVQLHAAPSQDPFEERTISLWVDGAELSLEDQGGLLQVDGVDALDADAMVEVSALAADGAVRAYGAARLSDAVAEGSATVDVLVAEVGEFAPVTSLGVGQQRILGAMAVVPGGDAYLFGGEPTASNNNGDVLHFSGLDVWDPVVKRVGALPAGVDFLGNPLVGRIGPWATAVEDDDGPMVLVTGGRSELGSTAGGSAEAFLFDPATDEFVEIPQMRSSRFEHRGVVMDGGNVVLFGGQLGPLPVEVYRPSQRRFTLGDVIPNTGAWQVRGAKLGDLGALVCGGAIAQSVDWTATDGCYRITRAGAAEQVASLPIPLSAHAMAELPGARVLVTGGWTGVIVDSPVAFSTIPASDRAFVFDYALNEWAEVPTMRAPRAHHSAVSLSDGTVAVVGGDEAATGIFGELVVPNDCVEVFVEGTGFVLRGCGGAAGGADLVAATYPGEAALFLEGWSDTIGLAGGARLGMVGTGP